MKNFDVLRSVVNFMNTDEPNEELELDESINKVIVFLIDGMTYDQGKYLSSKLNECKIKKIKAKFPTTTSAGYTSLITLSDPTDLGIFGRLTYCKKIDEVMHVFLHTNINLEPINTSKYLLTDESVKTIFEKVNCNSYFIISNKLLNSKYNERFGRGSKRIGFRNLAEIPKILKEINDEKVFIFVYDNELDAINHLYGSDSEVAYNYLDILSVVIDKMKNSENTRILIFSDHGHAKVDKDKVIDISWIYLSGEILPIAIEEKYLILKGNHDIFLEELEKKNVKYKHIVLNENNIEEWFGKYSEKVDFLIGSHFILMEDYGFFAVHKAELDFPPEGAHSGITKEEIEIPLIIL